MNRLRHLSTDGLPTLVASHLGQPTGAPSFHCIPTGEFNTSYFVRGWERELVLRIAPPDDAGFVFYERRMMAQEPEIHKTVRARTSAPLPEILAYDDSRRLIDLDYLIMERLPGRPLADLGSVSRSFHDRVLYQTGEYLRQIHGITSEMYGYLGAHKPMPPQEDWPSAFRVMWDMMVDDVSASGHYSESEAQSMRGLLSANWSHFQRPVPSSLLHMDIWSQNVLVDDTGRVTGILDLDRACWGDPEIEFAILDYCGFSDAAFWEGYGRERDLSSSARIRQVFYMLYELQKYIPIRQWRHGDSAGAVRYKRQVLDLAAKLRG